MPGTRLCRKDHTGACSCEMGNLYRYAEPITLLALAQLGEACGYLITQEARKMTITHAGIDTAVVSRTLHRLERAGEVLSSWSAEGSGPARKLYTLTDEGWSHVREWSVVLNGVAESLQRLCEEYEKVLIEVDEAKPCDHIEAANHP